MPTPQEEEAFTLGFKAGLAQRASEVEDVINAARDTVDNARDAYHALQCEIEDLRLMLKQARADMWRLQMVDRAQAEPRPAVLN